MYLEIDSSILEQKKDIELSDLYEDILIILDKRFDNFHKKDIVTYNDRYTFACPYCGDSVHDDTAKRGNLWFSRLDYKCYNCEVWRTLSGFLKDMKYQKYLDESYIVPKIDSSKYQPYNISENNLSDVWEFGTLSERYGVSRQLIKNTFNLSNIENSVKLSKYLEDRGLELDKSYMYSPYNDNIFILNIDQSSGKVISFQIRTWNSKNKYITFKLNKIYEKCKMEFDAEDEGWKFIDTISKFFNFTNIDIRKKIRVVEGSLDSKLLKNCFALCGLATTMPISNNNVYHIMDYDEPGRKKARDYIKERKNTFLWSKYLRDNHINVLPNQKLDITDLYLKGHDLRKMDNYFSNNPLDSISI